MRDELKAQVKNIFCFTNGFFYRASGRGYGYYYYQPKKKVSCKIRFPKKNNIATLYYFVDNTSLDVRNLTKLEDLHTLKTTRIKAKSSWVRKTFNKKNWACVFVKNGINQKKVKASKKKVTTL